MPGWYDMAHAEDRDRFRRDYAICTVDSLADHIKRWESDLAHRKEQEKQARRDQKDAEKRIEILREILRLNSQPKRVG